MAKRLYIDTNYFVIEDTVTNDIELSEPLSIIRAHVEDGRLWLRLTSMPWWFRSYAFNSLVDSEGNAFASEDSLQNFIRQTALITSDVNVKGNLEASIRNGTSFSAGTNLQAVSNTQVLKCRFANPIDSGVNCYVSLRKLVTASTNDFLRATLVIGPDAIDTPNTVTPSNLKTGSSSSDVDFSWKVESTGFSGGTDVGGLPLPLNGLSMDINVIRLVQPGEVFGYEITGVSSLLSSRFCAISMVWYEEPVI